jgi:hypothetical protein
MTSKSAQEYHARLNHIDPEHLRSCTKAFDLGVASYSKGLKKTDNPYNILDGITKKINKVSPFSRIWSLGYDYAENKDPSKVA